MKSAIAASVSLIALSLIGNASAQSLQSEWKQLRSAQPTHSEQKHISKRKVTSRPHIARATRKNHGKSVETKSAATINRPHKSAAQPQQVSEERVTPPPTSKPQENQNLLSLKNSVSEKIGPEAAARVFDGDPRDVLVLVNETEFANHAARLLGGEIYFQGNTADVCRIKPSEFETPLDLYVQSQIRKSYPKIAFSKFIISSDPCPAAPRADLLMIRRGTIQTSEQLGFSVGDALSKRLFGLFEIVPFAPFAQLKTNAEAQQVQNQSKLAEGTLDGFGSIHLPEGNSSIVCASSTAKDDFLHAMLSKLRDATFFEPRWDVDPQIVSELPDNVFVVAKRRGCGFVVGDATLLRSMVTGFKRDGVQQIVSSVFATKDDVSEVERDVRQRRELLSAQTEQEKRDAEKRAEADRAASQQRMSEEVARLQQQKVQEKEAERLAEIKKSNDEKARIEEVQHLRKLVASRGRTIADAFDARLRKHMESVVREIKDLKRRAALGDIPNDGELRKQQLQFAEERVTHDFPDWSAWYSDRVKEEWEFGDTVSTLEDYGTAKWKNRSIESISIKVETPMLNRAIGDRKSSCFVFTWINDEEFSFYREPQSVRCDSYKIEFDVWSKANQFTSQWNVAIK